MKNFDVIKSEIDLLTTDEEIEQYVANRLNKLENSIKEETIGQGYTDSYNGYIGLKTHYKPMASTDKIKCVDLKYDYIQPYINLIKKIKNKKHNELTILNEIFYTINDFAELSTANQLSRGLIYLSAFQRKEDISIKTVFENDAAFCSERSGMAQNLLTFLGIDSSLITGYIDSEPHAYNIIYPNGYGNEPMALFDVSDFVNFNSDDVRYSLAYFYGMNSDKYKRFISGKSYKVELSKTEYFYRMCYNLGSNFDFSAIEHQYIFGLGNNPKVVSKEDIEELIYSSHFENGVESVDNVSIRR